MTDAIEGPHQEEEAARNNSCWVLVLESGQEFPLLTNSVIVGRSRPRDHTLPDIDLRLVSCEYANTVSHRHCHITMSAKGECFIADLGSLNGTRVNGIPLIPHQLYPLEEGDLIQLGGVCLNLKRIRGTSAEEEADYGPEGQEGGEGDQAITRESSRRKSDQSQTGGGQEGQEESV